MFASIEDPGWSGPPIKTCPSKWGWNLRIESSKKILEVSDIALENFSRGLQFLT
jgi:hypothetical protein